MIYRTIYNPSHRNFKQCLSYILRANQPREVHYEMNNWGAAPDLAATVEASKAVSALAAEHGVQARPSTRPFRHSILSLAPEEDLTDREMVEVSRETMAGLARKYKPAPAQPSVIAVHRDTENVHTHLLSVPVDLRTGRRIALSQSVQAYRRVLGPIEERLGLKPPRKVGGWNDKRFHLPFSTWVRMNSRRHRDVRDTLLRSATWEQAMLRLERHGIRFTSTGKNFAPVISHYLQPFGARARDAGMSIQRDVFAGMRNPPTAREITCGWGRFPRKRQNEIEAGPRSPGASRYRRNTCIGSDRGELVFRRWGDYARKKRIQREQLRSMIAKATKRAADKPAHARSVEERTLLRDPKGVRREINEVSKPMGFSHWVEHRADCGDPDAQWLCRWGNNGANADPEQAALCAADGELDPGDREERSRAAQRELQSRRRAERDEAMSRARAAEAARLKKAKRRSDLVLAPYSKRVGGVFAGGPPIPPRGGLIGSALPQGL